MGRATIISETGAGLYTIKPLYDNDYITAETDRLTADILVYDAQLTALNAELVMYTAAFDVAKDDQNSAITDYNVDPSQQNESNLLQKTAEVGEAASDVGQQARKISITKLKKASAEKRIIKLNTLVSSPTNRNAWNVTLTEGLNGTVNTIEINGEENEILIGTFLDTSIETEILGQSVAGSLFNFSLFPYWQKWNPTYRIGTITSITNDLANVNLDAATSHYQSLNINQTSTLSNIPISYLSCNGTAFDVGDSVVIGFTGQDWSNPVILGFQNNPQPCPSVGGDIRCYTVYHEFFERGPVHYLANDIDGDSPILQWEFSDTAAFVRWNTLKNYIKGEAQLEIWVDHLSLTPTIIKIDFTKNGSYNLTIQIISGPDEDAPIPGSGWFVQLHDLDGLSPSLTFSGPGLGDYVRPNPDTWECNKGLDITIDNYVDGEFYFTITFVGQVNLKSWSNQSIYYLDIKNILG